MKKNATKKILTAAFVLCLSFYLGGQYMNYKDCIFHHGDYVRGIFGMVCINREG